jgi:alanine dehydrogenase
MNVGVPKEVKLGESRVAMSTAGVRELASGVNVAGGAYTHPEVAVALGRECLRLEEALGLAA